LDIAQRDACVKGCCDECVPECVWPHGFGEPGAAGYSADDPRGAVPVQSAPI
jgi:hypothetical protein